METPLDLSENRIAAMSIGDWLIIYLITAIPLINIVMLFVWAFGDSSNKTRGNWAKANLIWLAIIMVLYLFFFLVLGIGAMFNS